MAFERAGTRGLARLFAASAPATLALVRACWPAAVGRDVARRTEIVSLEGRTLRVRVPDARWRKALHKMQPQILKRLRYLVGELAPARLGFSEGAVAAPPAESEAAPHPVVAPAPPSLVASAQAIADPEIRAGFLAAAARYLSRR